LANAQSTSTLGFTAHRHDDDLGLVNMGRRLYDPTAAHFLSADPLINNPADGRLWNLYAYAFNNPITLTDPSGLQAKGQLETVVHAPRDKGSDPMPLITGGGSDSQPSAPPAQSADDAGVKLAPAPPELVAKWRADPRLYEDLESSLGFGLDLRQPSPAITTEAVELPANPPAESSKKVKPLNFEGFVWFSRKAKVVEGEAHIGKGKTGVKVEASAEVVFVHGWHRTGPFDGVIAASGGTVGMSRDGKEAYAGVFGGPEVVTQSNWDTAATKSETEPIILVEGRFGPALAGAYQTGATGEHTGSYVGVHFGPWGVGVGADLDLLSLLLGPFRSGADGQSVVPRPWRADDRRPSSVRTKAATIEVTVSCLRNISKCSRRTIFNATTPLSTTNYDVTGQRLIVGEIRRYSSW
jgi:RHS repeat-associated protein